MAKGSQRGSWIVSILLTGVVVTIACLLLAGRDIGRNQIVDGLRADGYDVLIDRSVEVGQDRYIIRVWERGIGWVEVER